MGTRNLTKVIDKEGNIRVAQYGQFDGYPSGQGANIVGFINEYNALDAIYSSLTKCKFISEDEVSAVYDAYNDDPRFDSIRDGHSGFRYVYPSLDRTTAGDILKVIVYSNNEVLLYDDRDFEADTLMCEGVFTIDYQTSTFTTRYHDQTISWSFDQLPTVDEYIKAFEKEA